MKKNLRSIKKHITFASQLKAKAINCKKYGSVVQLVRIHACHAWGRGFEPRPDRKKRNSLEYNVLRFFFLEPFQIKTKIQRIAFSYLQKSLPLLQISAKNVYLLKNLKK